MRSFAVESDSPDQDPFQIPLPCKIFIRDGQPVDEVIAAPEPTPLPPEAAKKAARKAATSKRIHEEITALQNTIAHNLKVHGNDGSTVIPDRGWDSGNPNHHFLNAYASGSFGRASRRERALWDREAYEDAKEALEIWRPRPWKGRVKAEQVWVETTFGSGHWEPIAAQPCAAVPETLTYTPEPTTATTATQAGINHAFENYATPITGSVTQLGDLEAALYAFAPKEHRLDQCKQLLSKSRSHLGPEDIIGDFAADLIHRFKSGQYLYHDGRFQVWIGAVWSRWFFPGVKTDFYKDANVTDAVNDRDFKDDQETGRKAGTLYRVDVDREQADRDTKAAAVIDNAAALADSIFRDLEDPSTVWGSVNEQTKQMLRDMRAGLTPTRNGRRLLKALRDQNPKAFVLGSYHTVAEVGQ